MDWDDLVGMMVWNDGLDYLFGLMDWVNGMNKFC